jgi:hypothetical protein
MPGYCCVPPHTPRAEAAAAAASHTRPLRPPGYAPRAARGRVTGGVRRVTADRGGGACNAWPVMNAPTPAPAPPPPRRTPGHAHDRPAPPARPPRRCPGSTPHRPPRVRPTPPRLRLGRGHASVSASGAVGRDGMPVAGRSWPGRPFARGGVDRGAVGALVRVATPHGVAVRRGSELSVVPFRLDTRSLSETLRGLAPRSGSSPLCPETGRPTLGQNAPVQPASWALSCKRSRASDLLPASRGARP